MAAIIENSSNSLDPNQTNGAAGDIPNDGTGVVKLDPWLEPFSEALRRRYSKTQDWIKTINDTEGGLEKFSRGAEKFGFNVDANNNIVYREWAPNATAAYLIGDFSKFPNSIGSICTNTTARWLGSWRSPYEEE
jgi:1,4-alpha-glucan branching enzyme